MADKNFVILHGWQSRVKRWQPLVKILGKNFNVYLPRLPGFGEKKLNKVWDLNNYAVWLSDYLKDNKIENPILAGHSNGGRIAIEYLSKGGKAQKLILIASAGIKAKPSVKKKIFLINAKIGKIIFSLPVFSLFKKPAAWFLYSLAGEKDYYQAEGCLKQTMTNLIKRDLVPVLSKIKIPALILWGREDKATPLQDAYIFKNKIKKSKLIVFDKAGHNLPFALKDKIAAQIIDFCQ